MRFNPTSFLLLVCLTGACHDASSMDPSGGRPLSNQVDEPTDAAPADAYESPRRDASILADAVAGSLDATSFDGGPDAAGGLDEAVCDSCEAASCRDVDGLDLYSACFADSSLAAAGAGAGMPRSALCRAVLHCARVTGCAANDPQPCFCGEGVSDILCLAGQAHGACKGEIETAAESTSAAVIADRLADPAFASGAAFNLLRYCEAPVCGARCQGGGGGLPDAGAPAADAGVADAHVAPPPDAGSSPCADLDQDGHPDCDETLVLNARLDSELAPWTAEYGAMQSWDGAHDGLGGHASGSIAVVNAIVVAASGSTMTGASQCVAASAGAYQVKTQVLIAAGQPAGGAGVNVQFYPTSDCSGPVSGAWSSDLVAVTGVWTIAAGGFGAPAGAGSMRVRLVAVKDFAAMPFEAHFDNILLERP
jgi:hypothetical protein